jgi:hypothetical protein
MRSAILLTLFTMPPAYAADNLRCDLSREGKTETYSTAITEDGADTNSTGPDALGFGFDSSLGANTYLVVLEDFNRHRHVAFTGSRNAISPDGGILSFNDASISCRDVPATPPSLEPPSLPEKPDYLVCMLDEAHFKDGDLVGNPKRHLRKQYSVLVRVFRLKLRKKTRKLRSKFDMFPTILFMGL